MKVSFKLMSLFLLMCSLTSVYAGERGGNGGDGIFVGNKLYLLDLVEAGLQDEPYFNPSVVIDKTVEARVRAKFPADKFPVDLLIHKLSELDKKVALVILKGMELYSWRLVSTPLINIRDDRSVLNHNGLVQLAIRRNSSVLIDANLWTKLDKENQTALVFHEILYAFIIPEYDSFYQETYQDSVKAREANGFLFSEELTISGYAGFNRAFVNFGISAGGAYSAIEKYGRVYPAPSIYIKQANDWFRGSDVQADGVRSLGGADGVLRACAKALVERTPVIVTAFSGAFMVSLVTEKGLTYLKNVYEFKPFMNLIEDARVPVTNVEKCIVDVEREFTNKVSEVRKIFEKE